MADHSQLTPVDPARDYIFGDPHSVNMLVEYGDYTCPHTRAVRRMGMDRTSRTGTLAAFTYRQNPARSRGEGAIKAARFALAAGLHGQFWGAHERLFQIDPDMPEDELAELAEELDLDWSQVQADMASHAITHHLATDMASAQHAGVVTTPTLFVNGARYNGPWDEDSVAETIEKPLGQRLKTAGEMFYEWAASAGLVLVMATLAALVFVNLGFSEQYEALIAAPVGLSIGSWNLTLPFGTFVNDGLMSIFFLIVGIEIKREIVDGELSSLNKAMLPLVGALGGMVAPVLIYALFNTGQHTQHGWGIPMATDIAFTLGLMALLGSRVPLSLKVFVSALAIADDLGAIVVIALFYSHGFHLDALLWAVGVLAVMIVLNRGRVYARAPYMILGIFLWYFTHESGLHATLAGVLTAAMIPSRQRGSVRGASAQVAAIFDAEREATGGQYIRQSSLDMLSGALERLREPGFHLQHTLEAWSNFLILPLFAFCNTGILLAGSGFTFGAPASLGIILGLVVGKPLGICLACWIAVRSGAAQLPTGTSWTQLLGAGCLAGVGFTMSIFIATSAFHGPELGAAKLAVLIASVVAATIGMVVLARAKGVPGTA